MISECGHRDEKQPSDCTGKLYSWAVNPPLVSFEIVRKAVSTIYVFLAQAPLESVKQNFLGDRMRHLILPTLFCGFVFGSASASVNFSYDSASNDDPPEISELDINGVMKYAMTQGLCQKVVKKKASKEEQQRLLQLFKRLAALSPTKGSSESWKKFTDPLVKAAKEVSDGKSAHKRLGKAANCTKCHKAHRIK